MNFSYKKQDLFGMDYYTGHKGTIHIFMQLLNTDPFSF